MGRHPVRSGRPEAVRAAGLAVDGPRPLGTRQRTRPTGGPRHPHLRCPGTIGARRPALVPLGHQSPRSSDIADVRSVRRRLRGLGRLRPAARGAHPSACCGPAPGDRSGVGSSPIRQARTTKSCSWATRGRSDDSPRHLATTKHDFAVYGQNWTPELLSPRYLRGEWMRTRSCAATTPAPHRAYVTTMRTCVMKASSRTVRTTHWRAVRLSSPTPYRDSTPSSMVAS